MAVNGCNKKLYKEYRTAHFEDGTIIPSGGTRRDTQVAKSTGAVSTGLFTLAEVWGTTVAKADAANEGQCTKLNFLRSPDGR
jgi:hypothetical protein